MTRTPFKGFVAMIAPGDGDARTRDRCRQTPFKENEAVIPLREPRSLPQNPYENPFKDFEAVIHPDTANLPSCPHTKKGIETMMTNTEAVRRLTQDGPMQLDVIRSYSPITREDVESDPEHYSIVITARLRITQQLRRGVVRCLCCDQAEWSAHTIDSITIKMAGIACITTLPDFRDPDAHDWPMLAMALCEHCIADRSTLRDRVLTALREMWPDLRSFPMSSVPASSTAKH